MRQLPGRLRVGIVGTGYISRGLATLVAARSDMAVTSVLTRRNREALGDFPARDQVTGSPEAFFRNCDLVVECSGDPVHAADVVAAAFDRDVPVVTMNSEFHVTVGSWFVGRGVLSEADGDQPGSIASLAEDAVAMGFEPLVYGNSKGFLNHNPSAEAMHYWARKLGIRVGQTISFTDGTKLQIEQALVANGLGAGILCEGLLGPKTTDLEASAMDLADRARRSGGPISDYVIAPGSGVAVFLVVRHEAAHRQALAHFKVGAGPHHLLTKNYHLCYLEIPKTINRLMTSGEALLTNGRAPIVGVCAVAKRPLAPGQRIRCGIGSYAVRGEAVRIADRPDHVPIGLLRDATIRRPVEPGGVLTAEDVDLPPSRAVDIWRATRPALPDTLCPTGDGWRRGAMVAGGYA